MPADLSQLATTLDLPEPALRAAIGWHEGMAAGEVAKRAAALADVVGTVGPWAGSAGRALAWFQTQPLPGFGGQTAEGLLKAGRVDALRHHLARLSDGGYA